MKNDYLEKMNLPADLRTALAGCPNIVFPESKDELYELCFGTGTRIHSGGRGRKMQERIICQLQ